MQRHSPLRRSKRLPLQRLRREAAARRLHLLLRLLLRRLRLLLRRLLCWQRRKWLVVPQLPDALALSAGLDSLQHGRQHLAPREAERREAAATTARHVSGAGGGARAGSGLRSAPANASCRACRQRKQHGRRAPARGLRQPAVWRRARASWGPAAAETPSAPARSAADGMASDTSAMQLLSSHSLATRRPARHARTVRAARARTSPATPPPTRHVSNTAPTAPCTARAAHGALPQSSTPGYAPPTLPQRHTLSWNSATS